MVFIMIIFVYIPYLLLGGKKNALFYSLQLSCLNFTLSLVQFILDVLTEKISHFSMKTFRHWVVVFIVRIFLIFTQP